MLGCVTVFGLLLGGICGRGLGLGLLLHWLIPAIDRGMATLCGLVATGIALLAFGQLLTLTEPSEAEEERAAGLAVAAAAPAGTRDPTPAQAPVTAYDQGGAARQQGEAGVWPGSPVRSPRAGRTLHTCSWRICPGPAGASRGLLTSRTHVPETTTTPALRALLW